MSSVKLVGITKPIIEDVESAEELVAYAARVSNPANQMNTETAPKLLKYLIKNLHWSPFEMVHIVMEINTTRDIARQILRHRSFSFQEFSQRYADPVAELEFVTRETRLQDTKNRQNSVELDLNTDEGRRLAWQWEAQQKRVIDAAREAYVWAVEHGIAKEVARAVLPEGNTMSRLYMNGTLRSWVHYIQLRSANGTQKEHMEIALACAQVISKVFPMLSDI
jgi:thymidylate synthase (FAD)